ncbi:MAG TPA: glycosyltransferase family 39 protein [Acidisarcina sp.]|nr:glycosyltransferase family 39 protein [Acidisarcina sp.]
MLNDRAIAPLQAGLCAVLAACVSFFVVRSLHWPLVNDASLMHYMSFLIDKGLVPYRDFGDMNMPGSLLADWLAVHIFGGEALAWRLFDLALMGVASLAILAVARPYGWFPAAFAAGLLVLFHGRDGMGQLGQRDLQMAVLMLVAYAFLFHALRENRPWSMGFFGVAAGMAVTMKPTVLPLAIALLVLSAVTLYRRRLPMRGMLLLGIGGLLLPGIAVCAWLLREHALAAFWHSLRFTTPYYASLASKSLGFMLWSSLLPPMRVLAFLAAVIAWKCRDWQTWEGSALILGVAAGMAHYILQDKGYSYHRYLLVAFLVLWAGIEYAHALRGRGALQALALAGVAYGCLVLPVQFLLRASHAQWSEALVTALQSDLTAFGGPQLSGQVQCLDSISGCGTALYRMRLLPSTGLLSDFLIFGPETQPIVRETRTRFWQALQSKPPRVIVVTSWLHLINTGDYRKLAMWPDLASYLSAHYDLRIERSFPANLTGQQGYRIYVLKP